MFNRNMTIAGYDDQLAQAMVQALGSTASLH